MLAFTKCMHASQFSLPLVNVSLLSALFFLSQFLSLPLRYRRAMSGETPNNHDSMNQGDSSTDSERTWTNIPPPVIDADLDDDDVSSMMDLQGPIILGNEPLDVAPLTKVCFQQQEVHVPQWLKEHEAYKEGDWKVFNRTRPDRRKDWVSDSILQISFVFLSYVIRYSYF